MSSDLKDSKRRGVFYSFKYALEGIFHGITNERNLRIHTIIAIIIILLGFFYHISLSEWMFIVIAIGGMLSLELMNTAIERVVDFISPQYHPLAKQAKDVAAGAVFIYACISVVIGCIIFIPKIL